MRDVHRAKLEEIIEERLYKQDEITSTLPYNNFLLIGNNRIGKSYILYNLLNKHLSEHTNKCNWYFIDVCNRYFTQNKLDLNLLGQRVSVNEDKYIDKIDLDLSAIKIPKIIHNVDIKLEPSSISDAVDNKLQALDAMFSNKNKECDIEQEDEEIINPNEDIEFVDEDGHTLSVLDVAFSEPIEISLNVTKDNFLSTVLKRRLDKKNFGEHDVIYNDLTSGSFVRELLDIYKGKSSHSIKRDVKDLINRCLGFDFKLDIDKNNSPVFFVDGEEEKNVSSGIKAILRLTFEIVFAEYCGAEVICIDEVGLHLNPRTARNLIRILQEEFVKCPYEEQEPIKWVWTTHMPDVIISTKAFNLIELREDNVGVANINDFDQFDSVYCKFDFFLNVKPSDEQYTERLGNISTELEYALKANCDKSKVDKLRAELKEFINYPGLNNTDLTDAMKLLDGETV